MNLLPYIAAPLLGALIGYCTNYIAVKMLFRPYYPIKIKNFTLPFTPGVIPKRKKELAAALGKTVGNTLFTTQDLESALLSTPVKDTLLNEITITMEKDTSDLPSLENIGTAYLGEESYQNAIHELELVLCKKIKDGFSKLDLSELISKEGGRIIKEKMAGSMFSMFLNDDLIASVSAPIGKYLSEYLDEHGQDLFQPAVHAELIDASSQSVPDLLRYFSFSYDDSRRVLDKVYTQLISSHAGKYLEKLDVAQIVEQKILDMEVADLEKLVFSVMKTELNAIVNLGALIGLLLGLVGLFF